MINKLLNFIYQSVDIYLNAPGKPESELERQIRMKEAADAKFAAATSLKCPQCLMDQLDNCHTDVKLHLHQKLSVVMNTIPAGSDPRLVEEHCFCGHPWLKTAYEDYRLWVDDPRWRESDQERADRRKYPTLEEWLK